VVQAFLVYLVGKVIPVVQLQLDQRESVENQGDLDVEETKDEMVYTVHLIADAFHDILCLRVFGGIMLLGCPICPSVRPSVRPVRYCYYDIS